MKKLFLSALLLGFFTMGYSQSTYYSDYTNSVNSINWESVATDLLLNTAQKQQLSSLNNQYPDYNSWNRSYANNPDKWSVDRYSSMQKILGSEKYEKFKNKYYKGQNPVALYQKDNKHDSRKKHLAKKFKNKKKPYKALDYEKSKKRGDGSHLWVKGQQK